MCFPALKPIDTGIKRPVIQKPFGQDCTSGTFERGNQIVRGGQKRVITRTSAKEHATVAKRGQSGTVQQ